MSKPLKDSGVKSILSMGSATAISRVLGLVREQVLAILFGASHAMDAFAIAFRIPNLLRDLFAEGAMSAALVPTLTRVKEKNGLSFSWVLITKVFQSVGLISVLIMILGIIYSDELVNLYAASYREVPGKFELTVFLTQVMYPFFPLVVFAAICMSVLNTFGYFFIPAFASALFNFFSITTGVAFYFLFSHLQNPSFPPILGIALGVVIGGLGQFLVQLPTLFKIGYQWKSKMEGGSEVIHSSLKKMLFLILPGIFGLASTQINILVNSILATSEGEGAVSWLNYAFRLMQFPIGIFGVSIAAVTLPRVSRYFEKNQMLDAGKQVEKGILLVFAINLPAAVGLFVLAEPIIRLLYEYGRFSPKDTLQVAMALKMYALGLVFYSLVKVFVPLFYALSKTRIPVYSSILTVILNLILNIYFVKIFGFWGLALGTSIAVLGNTVFLWWSFSRISKNQNISFSTISLSVQFGKLFAVSLCMGVMVLTIYSFLHSWGKGEVVFFRVLEVFVPMIMGVFMVLWMGKILKITELEDVRLIILRKLIPQKK